MIDRLLKLAIVAFIVLTLALLTAPVWAQATRPAILIGLDAQPVGNFDEALQYGNALHRFDDGPQHNGTIRAWLDASVAKGFAGVVVQAAKLAAAGVDPRDYPNVVAVAQDDEPDMAREASPDRFTAADAPHPSMIGWTRYEVLESRAADWRTRWPGVRISVNFAGPSLVNQYYASDLKYHARYIKASDDHGFDYYPANLGGQPYFVAYVIDKLAVTGNPADCYIEISDQALDGDETSAVKRGPTPNEQGTLVWSALGHGAKRLWYFPQRIGRANKPAFAYLNVKPQNRARAVADYATIRQYDHLIGAGARTLVEQKPPVQGDANKGKVVWPTAETFRWTLGTETLTVAVDYSGAAAPVIAYANAAPPPDPLADVKAAIADANSRAAAAQQSADAANARLSDFIKGIAAAAATQPTTRPANP